MLICYIKITHNASIHNRGREEDAKRQERNHDDHTWRPVDRRSSWSHYCLDFFILLASSRNLLITWFNSAEVDLPNANIQMKVNVQNQIRVLIYTVIQYYCIHAKCLGASPPVVHRAFQWRRGKIQPRKICFSLSIITIITILLSPYYGHTITIITILLVSESQQTSRMRMKQSLSSHHKHSN